MVVVAMAPVPAMTDLGEWRVFLRDFSDLALVRIAKDLRQHPEDQDYLQAVLEELRARARVRSGQASGDRRPPEKAREYGA